VDFWTPAEAPADPRRPPVLLFAGNPSRRKGFHHILEALQRLRRRYPDLTLNVAGHTQPDDDRDWYVDVVRRLGLENVVHLLGRLGREDLREQYRGATALVYPSIHEGSPRVVKEAAACGVAVVTARIPGTTVVDPAGDFFRYCPSDDPSDLAATVEELLLRPRLREHVSRVGRRRMVEGFSPHAIAGRTAEFYESLFRRTPGGR